MSLHIRAVQNGFVGEVTGINICAPLSRDVVDALERGPGGVGDERAQPEHDEEGLDPPPVGPRRLAEPPDDRQLQPPVRHDSLPPGWARVRAGRSRGVSCERELAGRRAECHD